MKDDQLTRVYENPSQERIDAINSLPNEVIWVSYWRAPGHTIRTNGLDPSKLKAAQEAAERTSKLLGF